MHSNTQATVDVVNCLRADAAAGKQVFYDIYSEEEKRAEPAKYDPGLSEVLGNEPPTHNCVGTCEGIANWRTKPSRTCMPTRRACRPCTTWPATWPS